MRLVSVSIGFPGEVNFSVDVYCMETALERKQPALEIPKQVKLF